MAKVKFSGGVLALDGKVGTGIYQKNINGYTFKQYVSPRDRRTTKQISQRNLYGVLVKRWQTITKAQRATWNITLQYGGKSYTGFYLFILRNTRGFLANEQISDALPTQRTLPNFLITRFDIPTKAGLSLSSPRLQFSGNPNIGGYWQIKGTKILSNGRNAEKYHKGIIETNPWTSGFAHIDVANEKIKQYYGKDYLQETDNVAFTISLSDNNGVPNGLQENIPILFLT